MKRMRKVLAVVLSLALVMGLINVRYNVKAADSYEDVTLTGTSGWDTSNDGTTWVLYLTTSGTSASNWSMKYKGFNIVVNGVEGTTGQVSTVDGTKLYCTIPTSLVPTTDGTTFTIKAGQYEPDLDGQTAGINILNDLQVVVSEGRLVHTNVIDVGTATSFNNTASSFYFNLYDKTGNRITTGYSSWNNFLSPAWCDGTRVTQDAVANQWSLIYSGVFVDGTPLNYWDAHFKECESGTYYIDGLSATSGTTVTIKGMFASSQQSDWAIVGNYFLKEFSFTYDGTNWNFSRPAEYIGASLVSTDGWNTSVTDGNWVLYLNTGNYTSTDWSKKYEGFTYEYNGVTGTTGQVSSAENNRLYCTIPTSAVPTAEGTTFTIKAGNYDSDATNQIDGIYIPADFDIVVNEGRLMHTTVLKPAAVEAFNSTASSFYFSLKDANGNGLATGCESWTNFLSPAWCDGTRVTQESWTSINTGVWVDGTPLGYWDAHFKNTGAGEFYIDGLSATNGTTIVVRGAFNSATQADWTTVGHFYLPEMTFVYDGSTWSATLGKVYTEYTGTPVFNHFDTIGGFYFRGEETTFPYAEDWAYTSYAEDDAESGVFVNGTKTSTFLKKVQENLWYVCLSDAGITPAAGDIIVVKGAFIYDDAHRITFSEAKFTWDGSAYKAYVEATEYNGTPKLLEIGEYGSAAGFYFSGGDGAPYDTGWSLTSTALDGGENGVFVNGKKTAINLKKTDVDTWYACIGDAGVILNEGDVVTIKGTFQIGDTADTVTFEETSFQFTGKHFMEGTPTLTEFTITGLAYSDIAYDTTNNRWNMYFTLSTNIPGDIDATYFPYMTYTIDGGEEITTHWFKSSSAYTKDEVVYYNLYFPIESLPQNLEQEYVITVKAGTAQGRVTGTNAALAEGIKLTEDYQFVVGGDYDASAPAIDYTMGNGGDANGIYLSSGDGFPTIGWDYSLTKVGDSDGIYVDGEATDVFIKKYADNQYYVCLSDKGIAATEGTIVMLKGAFTISGLHKVTFKTAKYIFQDGEWSVYSATADTSVAVTYYGDATNDATSADKVNSQDLVRIKRFAAGEDVTIQASNADLNGSGYIEEQDAALERWLLVNGWKGYKTEGVPTYEDDQEMRLAAYVSPTVAEGFTWYKEAGFTTLLGENRAKVGYENVDGYENFSDYMAAAKEAGLDVLVQSDNAQLMGEGTMTFNATTLANEFNSLKDTYGDTFRGYFLGDEPDISQLATYENVMTTLNSLNTGVGKDMFIAHHPIYTAEENLSTDTSLSLNEKYAEYTEAFGSLFDEYMYDFYPFMWGLESTELFGWIKNYGNVMHEDWFTNLEIVAKAGHGNFETGITVQSYAENKDENNHYRDITKEDVSFQVYSALAYGMKSITYFTYGEHWDTSVGTTSCMIYDGARTDTYYAVQAVNQEIKAIDHMMLNYNWQGTIGISGDDEDSIMDNVVAYTSPRISAYSATNDAIIGCLKDVNGYDGFMLVNATDPAEDKDDITISVTFNDADHAKVYINGEESIVELTNGVYSTTLTPGQGIFVIPYIA